MKVTVERLVGRVMPPVLLVLALGAAAPVVALAQVRGRTLLLYRRRKEKPEIELP